MDDKRLLSQRKAEQRITLMLWCNLVGLLFAILGHIISQNMLMLLGMVTGITGTLIAAILKMAEVIHRKRQQTGI